MDIVRRATIAIAVEVDVVELDRGADLVRVHAPHRAEAAGKRLNENSHLLRCCFIKFFSDRIQDLAVVKQRAEARVATSKKRFRSL